jgi:hypothetical protein
MAVLSTRSWPFVEPWTQAKMELGYRKLYAVDPLRLEGTGHFIMLDRPADLARAIARFAARPGQEPIAAR